METNKFKRCILSNSENFKEEKKLSQVLSNSNLNNQFWNSLRETINMKRESETIKGRIFTAKRILTPIIQELMNDTMKQIDTEKLEKEENVEKKGKEVKVLYNNLKAGDIWHVQKDLTDGEEWAMRILREISRDFEQPFDKLHDKIELNRVGEQSDKDIRLNKNLLKKLVTIHLHLGNIIERLNRRCKKKIIEDTDDSLNDLPHQGIDIEYSNSTDTGLSTPTNMNEQHKTLCKINSFGIFQAKVGNPTQSRGLLEDNRIQLKVEHACSVIDLENIEETAFSISKKLLYDVAVSYHALFDETKNSTGNKEIVIKCLEDLEKVRTYLEAIRDNRPCEKPKFCDLESCKNDQCQESQPHLHSNLHNMPMVLKLNQHAEDTERNSDLIIGIPSPNRSSPDVHILLNTKTDQNKRTQNQSKKSCKISRIPKPINKKRFELQNSTRTKSMRITLENKESSRRKTANLLIFDPEDPCKSIIKMKEQKSEVSRQSRSVFSLSFTKRKTMYPISKVPAEECLYFTEKTYWRKESKGLEFYCNGGLKNDMHRLFSLISFEGEPLVNNFNDEKTFCKENIYYRKDFQKFQPRTPTHYNVYFFECFKENTVTSTRYTSQRSWYNQTLNCTAHPIWTIKRSKYYSVPESKKKKDEVVPKNSGEKNKDQLDTKLVDSLENFKDSLNEIHLQMSEVSLRSSQLRRAGELETSSDKICQKADIKRKVSFREEVDVSEPDADREDPDLKLHDYTDVSETFDYKQHYSDETAERSPAHDKQEDIQELSTRISDLLMTASLMQIAENVSKVNIEKTNRPLRKTSPKNLKLTDSASYVLAKLSKSFEEEQYGTISGTMDCDLIPSLYDENRNPITEIYNRDGDLLFKLQNENPDKMKDILFDSDCRLLRNRYDVDGRQIKAIYDENGELLSSIRESNEEMKGVQADLDVIQYYDYKGKPIKHLYDSSGYEIKTVGKDLTSQIFDSDGRIHIDIYNQKGKRIDAVYDSRGRLLGRVSYSKLEPLWRRKQVRVANMDDSLNKLFESESKSPTYHYEDTKGDDKIPKRFFDQEGNPLIGVYNKKGKPLKVTSSGEADELFPFLFDTKGKLQSKRYDSHGKELKAVFGEDGKAISAMSIGWLNDLLGSSKNKIPQIKKKESIFRRLSRHKSRTEKMRDIEEIYDPNGKIITSVFDCKGKPLAVSNSGDAEKLLPFLFDTYGKFVKNRFDSEKRKLRYVYGRDGNIIRTISVTYLERLAVKLVSNHDPKECEDKDQMEESAENSGKASQETQQKMADNAESNKSLHYFEKVPDQLYDENGDMLTEIFDHEGKLLKSSSSGNAWKLLPFLFDDKGKFLERRFDQQGRKLLALYNRRGDNLTDKLSTAVKLAAGKALNFNDCKKESGNFSEEKACTESIEEYKSEDEYEENDNDKTNLKINEFEHNKNRNIDATEEPSSTFKLASSKAPFATTPKTFLKSVKTENKSLISSKDCKLGPQKQKREKEKLKPTTSITKNHSKNPKLKVSEITAKSGESIDRFYDEKGNMITQLYDAKGRILIETKMGEVEKLAKYLFDKDGYLHGNVYNQKGNKIAQVFDQKKRIVSRISVPSINSGADVMNKPDRKDKKSPGSVYDKNGTLIKEIYDKKGCPIKISKHAKLQDLVPIIFDEKGVRRRIYNKSGSEIGPIYDHKGKVLKQLPIVNKQKGTQDCKESNIFSKSGRSLRNFYDSDGTLIIALYNDYGKTLCSVNKGVNNAEFLSNFFFDKDGNFLQGRFYNYRGKMIKRVYDSKGNIVKTIKRTESRKIAHHKSTNRKSAKDSSRKIAENDDRLNIKTNLNNVSRHKPRGYHRKSEVRPVENIIGTLSSQSDTLLDPEVSPLQRSMSAYSLKNNPFRNYLGEQTSSSSSSLRNMSVDKFYDKDGRLLTGVYNSKTRLLGYSVSGNARVLAPFLFDCDGKFISGRYNLDRKPLEHVYDSKGELVVKISKKNLKNARKVKKEPKKRKLLKIRDMNGDVITSIYDIHGEKIYDLTDGCDETRDFLNENGEMKTNFFNHRGSELKFHENDYNIWKKFTQEFLHDKGRRTQDKRDQKELKLKGRISTLGNFKDKILTVIFDKQHSVCKTNLIPEHHKNLKIKKTKRNPKSDLFDENSDIIKDIYDGRGKKLNKVYNSSGRVIGEFYTSSGTLIKNNVLKSMFEDNVFKSKAYNSEGKLITTIFANEKLLKKVYNDKGEPARVDSDLIYLVSKQSLPADDASPPSKPATKQVNYFSEGSPHRFPERQNQNRQNVQNQQLTQGKDYETELEVAFNGFSSRRTDNCTCEHCQKASKNRKSIVQLGGELLDRLSRFTIPLAKYLPRTFLGREMHVDSEEPVTEPDSLETFIDKARQHSEELEETDKEYYGGCSRVSLLESDENIPISRKLVEKTLRKCVHLNSSTETVGQVSDTVLQHFANLILQEMEEKFYHKLNVLQCRRSSSLIFGGDGEKDICIGTELKFEDSLIGKHNFAQTNDEQSESDNFNHRCRRPLKMLTRNLELYGYFSSDLCDRGRKYHKVFVCKVPNLQPFVMVMNTHMES